MTTAAHLRRPEPTSFACRDDSFEWLIYQSVYLFINRSINLSIYQSIDRSINPSVYLAIRPPAIQPSIFPSFYLPVCTPYTTLLACQDHLELPPAPLQALEISMSLNLLARKDSPQGVAWTRGSYESSLQHVATKLLGTWIHMPSKMYQHACFFCILSYFFCPIPLMDVLETLLQAVASFFWRLHLIVRMAQGLIHIPQFHRSSQGLIVLLLDNRIWHGLG